MSRHARVNLRELDDSVAARAEGIEGRFGRGAVGARVSPDVVRAFAAGPEGLEIVAVGGPKPEGGDADTAPVSWP
jgi:hypothetical protein